MRKIKAREPTSALRAEGLHTFLGAYRTYKAECAMVDRSWNEYTQEKYESTIVNRIVPHLRNHDHTPIQDYSLEDFLHVIAELKRVGQNNDPRSYKPYDEVTLGQFLHIMKTVVKVASAHESFPNVFEEAADQKAEKPAQIQRMQKLSLTPKSFTIGQYKKILEYILRHLDVRGEYSAIFLCATLGLRVGEACGVSFSAIREFESFPGHYYLQVTQSTAIHSNQAKVALKTYNGYRNIPLPQLAVDVLFTLREKRIRAIQKCSGDIATVDQMPIAYMGKREFVRCSADSATRQAQKMFEELGMRKQIADIAEYLQQDRSMIEEEQLEVDEFALVESAPSFYALRRNWATMGSIMQLSPAELTYLLGHVIEDHQLRRKDFLDERELFAIKQKLDRNPLLNPNCASFSLTLQGNTTVQSSGYRQDFTVPVDASRVKLSVTAKEPNDPIHVSISLSDGTSIREEVGIQGTPFPHHFAKTTDVLRAYHVAFQTDDPA